GIDRRLENRGQTEQRRVHIKPRKRAAPWRQPINVRTPCKNLQERLLALNEDIAAKFFGDRCVANELKSVSKALLGVEQDRPVFKGVPIPSRLVKIPHREPPR